MPRHGRGRIPEKPKDFKASVKRLFKELKAFRILIAISLLLAAGGSILSISAPNRLSMLTDEISKGLIPNQDGIKEITQEITGNFTPEIMKEKMGAILDIHMDQQTMMEILMDPNISDSAKAGFNTALESLQKGDLSVLGTLDPSISSRVIQDSEYEGIKVSREDKLFLLSNMANMSDQKSFDLDALPDALKEIFFPAFTYKKNVISTQDQCKFLEIMSTMKEDSQPEDLFKKMDELPASIKDAIKPKMDMDAIVKISLFLVSLYLLSAAFTFIQALIMATVSNRFAQHLREKISYKINRLPLRFFDSHQKGDILSRVTNDVDTIAHTMSQSLSSLVSAITLFFGTIIII